MTVEGRLGKQDLAGLVNAQNEIGTFQSPNTSPNTSPNSPRVAWAATASITAGITLSSPRQAASKSLKADTAARPSRSRRTSRSLSIDFPQTPSTGSKPVISQGVTSSTKAFTPTIFLSPRLTASARSS